MDMSQRSRFNNWLFLALAVLYTLYAAVFIAKSSFVVEGQRYFALFDDSMISMTYARNLAHGFGPVWNPGDLVEGYTNPLWVGFMALIHLVLPLPTRLMSLPIQISGWGCMVGLLWFVRKIAGALTDEHPIPVIMAVFLTAFYYPLTNWSLLGTEVSVLLLMVAAGVWLAIRMLREDHFLVGLYWLMGVSTLVRFDMAVPYLVLTGFLFLFDGKRRKQHLLYGAGILILFLGGQTLLRRLYYHEWLPATYYLKMTGVPILERITRGWVVTLAFLSGLKWFMVPLPFFALLFRKNRKENLLLVLIFLAQLTYSIYVGGDSWEHRGGSNRFVSLGMPEYLLLFSISMWCVMGFLLPLAIKWIPPLTKLWKRAAGPAFILLCLVAGLYFNRLKNEGSLVGMLSRPANGGLRYVFLLERSIYTPGNERYVHDAVIIDQITTPQARIAVVAAGCQPYFSGRYSIDLLGKSDMHIAREPARLSYADDWINIQPGHIKWDYAWSIAQGKPDLVVELRKGTVVEGESYLTDYQKVTLNNHPMYLKKDSVNINWDAVQQLIVNP